MITLGADAGPRNIRFWVQDNGLGLTKEEREGLFVPFKRLEERHVQGHGLGLAIVRNIVERLGGEAGVESSGVRGEGCCFYFTLPRAHNMKADDAARLKTTQTVSDGNLPETVARETVISVNMIEQQA
jgi:signal transduction histidine kinase